MRRVSLSILATMCLVALVVVAIPALAAGIAPHPKKGGTYKGRSSQGFSQSLHTPSTKRVSVKLHMVQQCDGFYFEGGVTLKTKLRKHRRFKVSWADTGVDMKDDPTIGQGNITADFSGTARGRFYRAKKQVFRRVKGRFQEHATLKDGTGAVIHQCDTGSVTYKAKLRH
jgi:hypothetical protein